MEPLATCSATGVQVKYLSGIHYWARKAYISANTPFADTNEEMNFVAILPEQNVDESNLEAPTNTASDAVNADGNSCSGGNNGEADQPHGENRNCDVTDSDNRDQNTKRTENDRSGQITQGRNHIDAGDVFVAGTSREPTATAKEGMPDSSIHGGVTEGCERPWTSQLSASSVDRNEQAGVGQTPEATKGTRAGQKRNMPRSAFKNMKKLKMLADNVSFTCEKCGLRYAVKKSFEEHRKICSFEAVVGSSAQRAVTLAYGMAYLDKSVECYRRHDKNPNMEGIAVDTIVDRRPLQKGWARRPKWGDALAEISDVQEFKAENTKWFNESSACQSQKISAARMVQMLQNMFPGRCDIPSEQQVNAVIKTLTKQEKKTRKEAARLRLEEEKRRKNEDAQRKKNKQDETDSSRIALQPRTDNGHMQAERGENDERNNALQSTTQRSTVQPRRGATIRDESNDGPSISEASRPGRDRNITNATTSQQKKTDDTAAASEADTDFHATEAPEQSADNNTTNMGLSTKSSIGKKKKTSYSMPNKYGDYLNAAVRNENTFKRSEARNMMIKAFGYDGKQLPADFPSVEHVKRRISGVRYSQKKSVPQNHNSATFTLST